MNAYQVAIEQSNASIRTARGYILLAQRCASLGAPAPWALKLARSAIEDADIYMALARAELERTGEIQ